MENCYLDMPCDFGGGCQRHGAVGGEYNGSGDVILFVCFAFLSQQVKRCSFFLDSMLWNALFLFVLTVDVEEGSSCNVAL